MHSHKEISLKPRESIQLPYWACVCECVCLNPSSLGKTCPELAQSSASYSRSFDSKRWGNEVVSACLRVCVLSLVDIREPILNIDVCACLRVCTIVCISCRDLCALPGVLPSSLRGSERRKAKGSEGMLQPGHRRSLSPLTKSQTKANYHFVSPYQSSSTVQEYLSGEKGVEVLRFQACIRRAVSCMQPR